MTPATLARSDHPGSDVGVVTPRRNVRPWEAVTAVTGAVSPAEQAVRSVRPPCRRRGRIPGAVSPAEPAVVFSLRSRTNHYVNRTTLFPPSITHCSSIRDFLLDCRRSMTPHCSWGVPYVSGLNNHREFSQMKRRPQKKLNCSGRVPSRAAAHRFHSPVRLSSSRRRDCRRGRTPADSCNHWVSDWITCKDRTA